MDHEYAVRKARGRSATPSWSRPPSPGQTADHRTSPAPQRLADPPTGPSHHPSRPTARLKPNPKPALTRHRRGLYPPRRPDRRSFAEPGPQAQVTHAREAREWSVYVEESLRGRPPPVTARLAGVERLVGPGGRRFGSRIVALTEQSDEPVAVVQPGWTGAAGGDRRRGPDRAEDGLPMLIWTCGSAESDLAYPRSVRA